MRDETGARVMTVPLYFEGAARSWPRRRGRREQLGAVGGAQLERLEALRAQRRAQAGYRPRIAQEADRQVAAAGARGLGRPAVSAGERGDPRVIGRDDL